MITSFILENLSSTQQVAQQLSGLITPPFVLFLQGEVGAGKTTFVRALLQAWGYQGAVKSPTFSLVEPYYFSEFEVYHFDLYRLNAGAELEEIDWRNYFHSQSICLIEWPQQAQGLFGAPDLQLDFKLLDKRFLSFCSPSQRGEGIIAALFHVKE